MEQCRARFHSCKGSVAKFARTTRNGIHAGGPKPHHLWSAETLQQNPRSHRLTPPRLTCGASRCIVSVIESPHRLSRKPSPRFWKRFRWLKILGFRNSGNRKPPQSRRRPASIILRRVQLGPVPASDRRAVFIRKQRGAEDGSHVV